MKIDWEFLKHNPDSVLKAPIAWQPDNLVLNGENVHWPVPVQGELTLRAVGDLIRMSGELEGVLRVSCARCLKAVDLPLSSSFTVDLATVRPGEDSGEVYYIDGNEVDIEPILMEQILFNLPLRPVCSDECQGLCPVCGQDLNVERCRCQVAQTDPRWDALKKLMEGKEG